MTENDVKKAIESGKERKWQEGNVLTTWKFPEEPGSGGLSNDERIKRDILRDRAKSVASMKPEDWHLPGGGDSYSLNPLWRDVVEFVRFGELLLSLPLEWLPNKSVSQLFEFLGNIMGCSEDFKKYDFRDTNAKTSKSHIEARVLNITKELNNHLLAVQPFFILFDYNLLPARAKESLVAFEETNDLQKQKILEVEKMIASSAVSRYAQFFNEAKGHHERYGNAWLGLLVTLLIGAGYFVWNWLLPIGQDLGVLGGTPGVIRYLVSRAIILSFVYMGIVWSARNYRAHRHNAIVNAHRYNAIVSFEAFWALADKNQSLKDAVLLEATKCVFGQQTTGYMTGEPDPNPTSTILEIIKNKS